MDGGVEKGMEEVEEGGRAECVGVKGEHWKAPGKKERIKKRQRQTEVFIEITESTDQRIKTGNCEVLSTAALRNACGSRAKDLNTVF